jgi:hypothetical protein
MQNMRWPTFLATSLISLFLASTTWSQEKVAEDQSCQPIVTAYQSTVNSDTYSLTRSWPLWDGSSRVYQRQVFIDDMLWTTGSAIDWRLRKRPLPRMSDEETPAFTDCSHVFDRQTSSDLEHRYSAQWRVKGNSAVADILISEKTGKLKSMQLRSRPDAAHDASFINILMTYDFDLVPTPEVPGRAQPPLLPRSLKPAPCVALEDAWVTTQATANYGYKITERRSAGKADVKFELRKIDRRFYGRAFSGRWDVSLFPPSFDRTELPRTFSECSQLSSPQSDVLIFKAYWRTPFNKAEIRISKSTGKIMKITQDFRNPHGGIGGEDKTQVRVYDYGHQVEPTGL